MRRVLRLVVLLGLAAVGVRALVRPGSRTRKALRRAGDRLARAMRYRSGQWKGVSYRLRGRRPDPDVPDDVLADRIRSSIGGLEARLDVPHVHVTVHDGTATLHGDVGTAADAAEIEQAVAAVSGVVGVESFLHVGYLPSDTRPSEGARHAAASEARKQLLGAAIGAGVEERHAEPAVRAVLSAFVERLPAGEREHFESHLPSDVRSLTVPPRRLGAAADRARTVPELVAAVASSAPEAFPPQRRRQVVEEIVRVLHRLVPEEAADVAAVLPRDLRDLWKAAAAS